METIIDVITEVRATLPTADVLVVSDGSTDATVKQAKAAGALVLSLPLNLGVGGAMRAGFRYAAAHDYGWVVQIDADGQHDPACVAPMWEAMQAEAADIVIGARFAGKGSYDARGPRRWAMRLLARVLSRICRARLTDATSGLKLMNSRAIAIFQGNYPSEYLGDTIEALVIAARSGLRVRQVPVEMRERAGGAPSHNPLKSAVYLGRAFFALLIALTRPGSPLPEPQPAPALAAEGGVA